MPYIRKLPLSAHVLDPGSPCPTGTNNPRTYLHVDMDAFFASVEERDNPALKGRPIAVGGGPGGRGVVTSANYVARKFGLKAGMPAGEALRKCPQVIFLPVNARKYVDASARIMKALDDFAPEVRPLSIDEASLDISGSLRLFKGAENLGRALKETVRERFGLPCTVGIAPNRLMAKVAAGLAKPDGLMVVAEGQAARVLAPLPVDEMLGIGPATKRALDEMGIRTLGRLAEYPEGLLKARFGVWGPALRTMARGEWAGRMRRDEERGPGEKSIGHQRTFDHNISDPAELRGKLVSLAEMVARRTRKAGMLGKVLTLTVRFADFHTFTHQTVLPEPTDEEQWIIHFAWKLLDEALFSSQQVDAAAPGFAVESALSRSNSPPRFPGGIKGGRSELPPLRSSPSHSLPPLRSSPSHSLPPLRSRGGVRGGSSDPARRDDSNDAYSNPRIDNPPIDNPPLPPPSIEGGVKGRHPSIEGGLKPIRLLGLSLGRLAHSDKVPNQADLFAHGVVRRPKQLYLALDSVRDRWGERAIGRAMGERWKSRNGAHINSEEVSRIALRGELVV